MIGRTALIAGLMLAMGDLPVGRSQDVPNPSSTDLSNQTDAIATQSGTGRVALDVVPADSGAETKWAIRFDDSGSGMSVVGTVTLGDVPIGRPSDLCAISWSLQGTELSGTVSSTDGNIVMASFKGTINADRAQGTFSTMTGQSGSWTWSPSQQPTPPPPVEPNG